MPWYISDWWIAFHWAVMVLFSIVILTYNRADLVGHTIESVFSQRFRDYELIVVDDGSTDDTPAVLAQYSDRAQLVRQENQGIGGARNTGLLRATGDYVIFLDSDDLWFPWTLETLSKVIAMHNGPAIVRSEEHTSELQSRQYLVCR